MCDMDSDENKFHNNDENQNIVKEVDFIHKVDFEDFLGNI
jgi:hypothetical protein